MSKYPTQQIQNELSMVMKLPKHLRFHESKEVVATALSGVSSVSIPLTQVVGKCSNMFFIVRPVSSTTGDNAFNFFDIKDFQVVSGGSANVVGGQSIASLYNRTVMAQHYNKSFYLADILKGVSNAFVFQYSWSLSPFDAINSGKSLSYRVFDGSEQLTINFNSALSGTYEIRGYFFCQAYIALTGSSSERIYA